MTRTTNALLNLVSFGTNIYESRQLETRTTGEVLDGIRNGMWKPQVEPVRRLYGSSAYDEAKRKLPFVILSGVFARCANNKLIQHSGQIGIDVDDLTPRECLKTISRAALDRYCLAAFHSVSGRGVRLVIRVPTTLDQFTHKVAFRQVASRVRDFYHVEPDRGGSNVSRLCFVSFDKTMVINPSAKTFPVGLSVIAPIILPDDTQRVALPKTPTKSASRRNLKASSPVALRVVETPNRGNAVKHGFARLLGMECAPLKRKPDGFSYTHESLLRLAKRLAVTAAKGRVPDGDKDGMLNEAFYGWWLEAKRNRRILRCGWPEYREELAETFRGALKTKWIKGAATKWTRWRDHPDFPRDGTPRERLRFAIRCHCAAEKTVEFSISSRDAGDVAGVSNNTASKLLLALCHDKLLSRAGRPWSRYHALQYRLKVNTMIARGGR